MSSNLPHIDSYSVWLIPEEKSKAKYSQLIKQLAEKHYSESFQPHITLAGVPDWPEDDVIQAMERISKNTRPFQLAVKEAHCKSSPYQKITVEVEKSGDLNSLYQKTNTLFGGDFSKKEYPHISLLYSTLSCKHLQQDIIAIKKDLPKRVYLNRIALVHCKGTPEDWRTLYMNRLD